MARIDKALIKALVVTRMQAMHNVDGMTVLQQGDQEPQSAGSGAVMWCRLVAIDFRVLPRVRQIETGSGSAEPEHAEVVVTINVFCNRAAMMATWTAIDRAGDLVCRNLGEETLLDAATTHQLDLRQAAFTSDAEIDEQRGIATGVVVIPGIACRTSGVSLTSYGS